MARQKVFQPPVYSVDVPRHKKLSSIGDKFWKEFDQAVRMAVAPLWSELMLQHFPQRIPKEAVLQVTFCWSKDSHHKLWIRMSVNNTGLHRRRLHWARPIGRRLKIVWESFFGKRLYVSLGELRTVKVHRPSKSLIKRSQALWAEIEKEERDNHARKIQLQAIRRRIVTRGEKYLKSMWPVLEQRTNGELLRIDGAISSHSCSLTLRYQGETFYIGYTGDVDCTNRPNRRRSTWKSNYPQLIRPSDVRRMFQVLEIPACSDPLNWGVFKVKAPSAHEIAEARLAVKEMLNK